jgi:putative hydrolase of HD superfamily
MFDSIAVDLLATYQQVLSLKLLPRTGWLQRGVTGAESIAAHSFGVTALALLVGAAIPGLDRGRLLALAVLHDMAEVALTDLPASATRLLGRETKRTAERAALEALFAALPAGSEYLALWEEYAAGASREARLVKGLDRLEMLAQALAYERAGNRALGEFWQGVDDGWDDEFPLLREMALALSTQRDGGWVIGDRR